MICVHKDSYQSVFNAFADLPRILLSPGVADSAVGRAPSTGRVPHALHRTMITRLRSSARIAYDAVVLARSFGTSLRRGQYHFDTHHFVQRLEREGLSREQAEGIMSALASVIEEAARNMTANMVTKAENEKVRTWTRRVQRVPDPSVAAATLYAKGGLCAAEVRASTAREERRRVAQGRERPSAHRRREAETTVTRGNYAHSGRRSVGLELGKGYVLLLHVSVAYS